MDPITQQPPTQAAPTTVSTGSTATTTTVTPEPSAQEIIRKAVEAEKKTPPAPVTSDSEPLYNSDDIAKIADPVQRKIVEDIYKNMEKGLNKRFMKIAEKEKALDQQLQSVSTWTPERLEAALRDPSFVQAAQARLQAQTAVQPPPAWEGTQEQWSALSDSDKQAFHALESKVNVLLTQQNQMLTLQDDEYLKQQHPTYDPAKVESFQRDILDGRVTNRQVRELIHKALTHDEAVKQAYRFGRQDRNGDLQEKLAGSTTVGTSVTTSDERPVMQQGEAPRKFFTRLAEWNLANAKKTAGQRSA